MKTPTNSHSQTQDNSTPQSIKKVYVAGNDQDTCLEIAMTLIIDRGYSITSSWLNEDFSKTSSYSEKDRQMIADKDVREVSESDLLVLCSSDRRVPGGKFVEVGVALGLNIPVVVIGRRENMLMWHSSIKQYDSIKDFLSA